MKIHSLNIKNIASLKGQHSIDFDSVFKESSLFAITGKTGAGKSTILNCISLALYGRVYKDDSQHLDFVTLGEAEGSIELHFSNLGKSYQASWHMKLLKKNGEAYKKAQLTRTLALKQEEEGLQHIDTSIEEILHLSFEQFCKTTILNQGQFAKLLTSSFSERKDILEKFYNGINLELLNTKLLQKLREKKSIQEEIQNQILGFSQAFEEILISSNDLEDLKEKKDNYLKCKNFSEHCLKNIEELQKTIDNYRKNKERMALTTQELSVFQKEFNKHKKDNDHIHLELKKQSDHLSIRRPILVSGAKKYSDQLNAFKQKELISKEQESLDKKQELLLTKQKELSKTEQEIQLKCVALEKEIPILALRDTEEIARQIEMLIQNTETEQRLEKELKDLEKSHQSLEVDIERLKSENTTVEKTLKQLQNDANEEKLLSHRKKYQDLLSFKSFDTKSQKQLKKLNLAFKETSEKEEEKLKKLSFIELKKEKIQTQLLTQSRALEYFLLASAIHECEQASLKENNCLVCKRELPKNFTVTSNQKETERKQIEQEKQETEKKQEELQEEYNNIKVEKLALSARKERIRSDQKELQGSVLIEKQTIGISDQAKDLKDLDLLIAKVHQEVQLLDTNLKEQQSLKQKTLYLKKDLDTKIELFQESELAKKKTQILFTENKVQKADLISDLQFETTSKQDLHLRKESIHNYLSLKDKNRFTQKDLTHTKENLLEIEALTLKYKMQQKEQQKIIDEASVYLEKNFKNNKADPNTKLQELEKALQQQQMEALEHQKVVSKEEVKLADINYRLSNFTEQISGLELLIESLKNILQEQASGFLNSNVSIEASENTIKPLLKIIEKLQFLDKDDNLSLAVLNESYNSSLSIQKDIKNNYQELAESFSAQLALFNKKQENEKKITGLIKKKKVSDDEINGLNDLYALIGKDSFRNYILSLIENTLIEQTNKELENLYQGRYSLAQTHKKNKSLSEFIIIDYFRDGMSRKVSTLSGGETFLVSLAMALALAELTRGNTEIDSLFIDEGFGTLDSDSIDEVFELLETIQHSGKQIGIISHVQSLTSRIGININLNKSTEGSSKVDIIYN